MTSSPPSPPRDMLRRASTSAGAFDLPSSPYIMLPDHAHGPPLVPLSLSSAPRGSVSLPPPTYKIDRSPPQHFATCLRTSGNRNLVLLFDGTRNTWGKSTTNIPSLLSLASREPGVQVCYYQSGIGTTIATRDRWFTPRKIFHYCGQLLDAGVAWSMRTHIQKGYEFLMNHYQPGDAIFLFGFSRGAYTARALAGMLEQVGLLYPGNEETIPLAFSVYRKKDDELAAGFKRTFAMRSQITVKFVGVFDTVHSVGGLWPRTLPFAAGSSSIQHFRQALSLDERRARYAPEPWNAVETAAQATIKEVWFVGSHSNVGGGEFPDNGNSLPTLSRLPLRWMLREAVGQGFELDSSRAASSPVLLPFWQRARDAVLGRSVGAEGETEENEVADGLRRYLQGAREKNPDVNPVVAACVYLASLPSAETDADALAPRADHLGLRIEKRPREERRTSGLTARLKGAVSRAWQRVQAVGWRTVEFAPAPRVQYDPEVEQGKVPKWQYRLNRLRPRRLTSHPSLHYSVNSRINASPADLCGCGNNKNYPEKRCKIFPKCKKGDNAHYQFAARFRTEEGMTDVEWVA